MQDERKYLIEIPGMEGSDVWDADRWERNKDRLLNDHKDVNVFELGAYDPEDEKEGDQFLISMEGMDGGDLWDAERWSRNRERFLADNPTATVNRVRYVDYWGGKADENRAKRSELMQPDEARNAKLAELGYYDDITGGQVELDVNAPSTIGLKPLSSAVKENSVSGATEYLDPKVQEFFANDTAYTERQAEIARLDAEYEQNPAVIRYREWQAQQAEEQARYAEELRNTIKKDLDENVDMTKAARAATVKRGYDPLESGQMSLLLDQIAGEEAGSGAEENEKYERYTTALKFLEKAEFAREHAGKGAVSGAAIGVKGKAQQFGAGIGEFAYGKVLDAATQDDIETYNEIGDILSRLEDKLGNVKAENITPEILEENLTKDEQALILAFYEYNRTMAETQKDMSKWYKGGKIFAESVPFMLEFLATGGLYKSVAGGASNVAKKGLTKALAGFIYKKGAKKAAAYVMKGGKALAGAAAGTLARTLVAPGTYSRMAEATVEIDNDGHLHRGANAARAAADMYIENLSEISGGLIGKGLGLLGKGVGIVGKGVGKGASWAISKTPFAKVGSMLADNQLMQTIGAGIKTFGAGVKSFMPKLEALGFHGLPEEIGEEFIGNAIRDVSRLQPGAFKEMFEDDNFGSMLIGFAPMTLIGAAGGVANIAIVNRQAAKMGEEIRNMFSHGYDQDHVNHMMSSLDTAETPEQMQQAVKPIVSAVIAAMESGMITKEQGEFEIESLYQYAGLMAQNRALLFGKKQQDRQLADAKKAELEQEYGTFWQENEGKQDVQVAKLNNGSTVFVVSTPEADGKIMTVDTQTGQKGFANTADIVTEEVEGEQVQSSTTMSLDQFLNTRIALERQTSEQNRMLRERQEQIDALRSQIKMGTKINLGTEGSPIMLYATGTNNAGVVVMDQNGAQMTLPWEQAADALGKPIIVKTDAQISDALVAAKAAEFAERRQARANSSLTTAAAQQTAAETAEVAAEENRHIPMKEDGTVNEAAFWEQDPEGYVKWNDEQNKDGGQDSLQQIAIAKIELTRLLDEQTAAQNTSNPEIRKAAKAEAARLAERIAQLDAIEQSYMQDLAIEQEAVQQTNARPTAEMSEQDLEQMDTQYQNILGKTRVKSERVRVMQEYLNKLAEGSVPVVLLTKENFKEVMTAAGCSEKVIKRVEKAMKRGRGSMLAGFASNGTAFVVADTIKDIEAARITYVHERQHLLNKANRKNISDMRVALGSRENAIKILNNLATEKGAEIYQNDSFDQLADEIICRAMEIVYTTENYSVALQNAGASQEVIDVINNIDNGQNTTQSNLAARRRRGSDSYADGSGRANHIENGGNSQQVSGGLLGQQEAGSVGSRGRGDGSRGSGEPGAEVDSEENVPMRVVADEDLPEANLSEETKAELAEKDLVMEGGAIMSTEYADLKHETGYQTPIERNTDADDVRFSMVTIPAWKEHYMSQAEAERRVVQYLEAFAARVAANELVNGVVSHGKHKYGKKESGSFAGPLRTNDEYVVTFDLDTSCPRTFQYLNYVRVIERRIGRPLTQIECIQLTEIMRMYGQQIPCVYCYAENKRQALKQYYTDYMTSRHTVISAKTDAEALAAMYGHEDGKKGESDDPKVALKPAAYKVFLKWRENPKGTYNPTLRMLWHQYSSDRNSILTMLDSRAASGIINVDQSDELIATKISKELGVTSSRAMKVIEEIVAEWKWNTIESKAHDDFTPVDEDDIWVNEKALDLWRDMTSYAKSASSAKGVLRYTPYTDELKKLSQEDRDYINGMSGVRMHSSNDFRIDYVIDYFQFMADMALYKMFGHTYTKSPEFVRIFGNSGYKINMSIAAYQDENGNIRPNVDEGFDWTEAQELRRLFPNVGTMLMATSDEQLQMALDSDWIDMCIPFHRSGLPKAVWYNMRLWTDYENKQKELFYNTTEMTEQLVADGVEIPANAKPGDVEKLYLEHFNITVAYNKKGERIKPHFLPGPTKVDGVDIPGHFNNHQRYLDLCKEWGVKPRFQGIKVKDNTPEGNGRIVDITEHPRYMIFVKETARTDTPQTPVQFNFDEPSEALDGRTPLDYAFEELEARAMAEAELAGGKVSDIYNSLNKDQFGIIDQFINTVIKHKEETGEDYPLDYITPEARDWFLVQRKALEEAFQGVESIPYHRNEYDELGNLTEGVGLENARREEEERIAAEEKAAKEAAKAAKAAARKAAREAAKKAKAQGPINLIEEAKKSLEDEVMMRFIGEEGAARLDAVVEAGNLMSNLTVARAMETAGKDARAIKAATGWERGADNKWRYEQEDFEFKAKPGKKMSFKLSDLINDIMLFTAYPQLKDVKVQYTKLSKGSAGDVKTDKDGNRVIRISNEFYRAQNPVVEKAIKDFAERHPDVVTRMNAGKGTAHDGWLLMNEIGTILATNEHYVDEMGGKDTLVHEIQHLIQEYEGFALGGNESLINTTDPETRKAVKELKRVIGVERKLIEEYRAEMHDIFTRGRAAEQAGRMQEALRLRAELDNLIRQTQFHINSLAARERQLSNYAKIGIEGYARLAGEVEARNVEERMDMTFEQRRQSLIEDTQDVATKDQIFILNNLMMNYDEMADVSFRITPEEDAEYMNAVETGDERKALQMVEEAARKAGYTQKVYRVDAYEGDRDRYKGVPGGVYYAESLDYFDHSDTGHHREDAEVFYINTDGFFDPMNEMRNLIVNAWADILGRESDFEKYGIEDESDTDRGQYNDGEEILTTSTEGLAYAAQENGYKGVILRDIPQRGFAGSFTEYAIFDSDKVKSAEAVTYDNEGNVIPLSERFQEDNEDIRFSMIGEVGALRDKTSEGAERLHNLETARQMEQDLNPDWTAKENEAALKIKMATGWERGADGLWRYETEDIKMKPIMDWLFSKKKLKLRDIVEDGELLRLYPDLADISIVKMKSKYDLGAVYYHKRNEIALPFGALKDDVNEEWYWGKERFEKDAAQMYEDIIHEVQHAIQRREGFARGGNESMVHPQFKERYNELTQQMMTVADEYNAMSGWERSGYDGVRLRNYFNYLNRERKQYILGEKGYRRLAGEVEARNVELRREYTPEQRRQSLLASTEDVAREDMIFILDSIDQEEDSIRFRMVNENQAIFVSNAAKAVEAIKQEKATPEQWLKMIEKNGGLKAGEDKWMGLSDWLKASDKKTLTKQEVLDFVNENMIIIEEQHYGEIDEAQAVRDDATNRIANGASLDELQSMIDENAESASRYDAENENEFFDLDQWLMDIMVDEYGDDFPTAYTIEDGIIEYADIDWWDINNEGIEDSNGVRPIDETRLGYTTPGLENLHEIALTVPFIQPWETEDTTHFGDAGEGRAIAWIRFGDKTLVEPFTNEYQPKNEIEKEIKDYIEYGLQHGEDLETCIGYAYNQITAAPDESVGWTEEAVDRVAEGMRGSKKTKVLVIDEIQSNRHQEGREKGYATMTQEEYTALMNEKYGTQYFGWQDKATPEEWETYRSLAKAIPAAPFEKNWHELAMKRMLRYAAENGYDVVAWTKGDQQVERYDIGGVVSEITVKHVGDKGYEVESLNASGYSVLYDVYPDASAIADVYGKELAAKIVESVSSFGDKATIEGNNLRLGGEGMRGFYDHILPKFMDKYGKKWGVKTTDIELDLEDSLTMHSVPVTEEMKESVMEGQVMFRSVAINEDVQAEMAEIKERTKADGTFMKAPNGKNTYLTEEQWLMVRTKNFRRWFGDWMLPYVSVKKVQVKKEHPFDLTKKAQVTKKEVASYAEQEGIIRTLSDEETNGKGDIIISKSAIEKIVDDAYNAKDRADLMLGAITSLPELIRESKLGEEHFSYAKGADDVRRPENGINEKESIFRYFGAIESDGETYRVKITVKRDNGNRSQRAYTYEVMKIELTSGKTDANNEALPTLANSMTFAKLLDGVENDKKNGEKLLDFSKVVDANGEPMVVYHGSSRPERFNIFRRNGFIWFTEVEDYAKVYANLWSFDAAEPIPEGETYGQMYGAFVNARNPYDLGDISIELTDMYGALTEEGEAFVERVEQETGVDLKGLIEGRDGVNEVSNTIDQDGTILAWQMTKTEEFADLLASRGYDAVLAKESESRTVGVLNPNQIKSATENTGAFSEENDDIRFRTSMDLDQEFGDAWRDQQNEDGRHSTQVANTKSTYEKIGNWMKEAGLEGASILDASSGLGLGTQALREMGFQVDDVEPFPSENREAPTFGSYDDIDGKYDVVISNAVLNVIPDDWRADVLHKMAAVVKDGGKIIINTRPASNISKQGVEGKTRITLDSPSEILVKRGDRIAAYQKGFTSEELADWVKSELGEGWRVEKATKKNSGISGEGTAVVIKEGDVSFRTVGTPTEQIVAEGVNFSKKDLASLAGDIFAALPEESRRKITDRLNGNLLGLQDAIMQIPTDLAVKDEWSDEDKAVAGTIAAVMTDAVGKPMSRPFTAREALWTLYDATNKATDLVSEASRALVKRNLGFDSASLELQEIVDEYVNFRTVANDKIDAATDMYNYETSLWTERLKESWLDMNQSVESLQRAMAKGSGMEIEPWENVVLALNRLSSKSYADKKKYLRDFLIPMWDAVLQIAGNRKDGVEYVERYLMLKHGLERNKIFAKRDAKEYYRAMYDLVAERMANQTPAQQQAALAAAQQDLADIDAQIAAATPNQLGRLNAARKKILHDLQIATLVVRGDEKENERELKMYYDAIDNEYDVKYQEFREQDYGGLTSMFMDVTPVSRSKYKSEEAYHKAVLANQKPKYTKVADMEAAATTEIDSFESSHNVSDLWAKINAATKEVLRHQHEAGMITDEQYDAVRNMFEYYVPLRGFEENTAEDMYSYYMDNSAGGFAKPIIAAKGRKTKAESPLGWIGSMAESGIQADNKNEAKMALYYAALRRPDLGILSLTETWFEYTGQKDAQGRKIFAPAYPPATTGALSAADLRNHMDTWENSMRQKQSRGEAYHGSQRVNLKGSVVFQEPAQEQEHVVRVKVAGKDYSILINGNPRAAQAINGILNPEANKSVVEEWIGVARRAMSSLLTSFSPLFWVANYQRDLLASVMRTSEADGAKAAWQYLNNRRKAWRVASYVYKYDAGTMGNSYYEQMYKEFAENGGITGYTVLTTNKEYEKLLEDYAKQMGKPVAQFVKNVWEKFMGFGEAVEQVSRFAAYLTAREAGKSIEEAVNAAKEVSVNFNRKGSVNPISISELDKLRTKDGKPLGKGKRIAAIVLSAMPKWMKELYFFFNASVQAISSTVKLAKKSPGKAAAWAGMYFGMSVAMAVINNLLSGDDDEEEYMDLPDYLRHSTILIKVGDGYYLKWSLPQEMRPFYAWADIMVSKSMGKMPHKNAGLEMALAAAQWLPVNPFDSEDPLLSLVPDVAAPLAEIKFNKTSFGSKVYNDMPFMSEGVAEEIPGFRKATSKTGKVYVDLAEFLNDVTGGDEVTKGWADFNPAKLEHLVEGYGGGIYDFAKMMVSLPGLITSDEPVKVKDIPFVNKVLLSVDETNMNSHTNEAFMYYKDIADNAKRVESEYRASEKPERADAYRNEEDWRIFLLYNQYEGDFKAIKEKLDEAADQAEIDILREQQNDLREMFLNDIANNVHADAEVQMKYDVKRYESELREFLEPVTEANKERLEMKKQRNWKAMNKARRQRDSLRRLPEYKLAESVKKDLKEFKEQLATLDTMSTPAHRDSFLSKLQIDYDEIVRKLGELDIE